MLPIFPILYSAFSSFNWGLPIMVEYINQLRARGATVEEAALEGALLRLRPIMMTMLVATLGLLPAAVQV